MVCALALGLATLAPLRGWGQSPQSWVALSTGQNLPHDWSWSAAGQLRTSPGALQWSEGIVDVGVGRSFDRLSGWSVDGTWRTGWDWPPEGGWTTSWRWATSLKWRTKVGDHSLRIRARHQFGGPWMRSWDRARWRLQVRWTHDLPDGMKLIPAVETFWGREGGVQPAAVRGRLSLDKKLSKRRHVTLGYQFQTGIQSHLDVAEHTVLLSCDLALKKVKKRKKDDRTS